MSLNLDCSVSWAPCVRLVCGLFNLESTNSVAGLEISGKISEETVRQMDIRLFSVKTNATVRVPGLDPDLVAVYDSRNNTDSCVTEFSSTDTTSTDMPLWQIIISVVAALILLLVLIIILVKVGFFRRKAEAMKQEAKVENEFE